MSEQRFSKQIGDEVTSWPGVSSGPGRFGAVSFKLGQREIGHLHGEHSAHFSFPKSVWRQLRAEGRIEEHPVFPGREGPAARGIESEDDAREVIALMRLKYDRVVERHGLPDTERDAA